MLTRIPAKHVATRPASTAIVQADRRISYEALDEETARWAARLRNAGVVQGDTIAMVLPNCPELVVAFFAAVRVRAVAMPLNPAYTPGELTRFLSDRPAQALITDAGHTAVCRETVRDAVPVLTFDDAEYAEDIEPIATDESFDGAALCLFTSRRRNSAILAADGECFVTAGNAVGRVAAAVVGRGIRRSMLTSSAWSDLCSLSIAASRC